MQKSQTYDYEKNDHINRANIALICSQHFGIRDVSPSLYEIAAPVSELACCNKDGGRIRNRDEIQEAFPWDERSMKTFGVVYNFEAIASFIGIDGKTYVVPNDEPVLEHLKECGYVIAPYGRNLDGNSFGDDSLVERIEEDKDDPFKFMFAKPINRNLPQKIVDMIEAMEKGRPYFTGNQSYADLVRFGGTLGISGTNDEELSLSERKVANICRYSRVFNHQDIEEYVQFALQQYYLDETNFPGRKKL